MPKIPRHRRQVTKTATVGQAPLPLDIADTGAQAIGQGLQRLGAGLEQLGAEMKQQRDTSDYWKGLGEYQTALNNYNKDVRDGKVEPGEESYTNAVMAQQDIILKGKSSNARRRLKDYWSFHDPFNISKVRHEAFTIQQSRDIVSLQTTMEAKLEAAANSGSEQEREFLKHEVEAMIDEVTPRLITPEQGKKLKDAWEDNLKKMDHFAAVSDVHAQIEAKNFEAARVLAKSGDIPEKEQTTLRKAIDSAEVAAKDEDEILRQTIIDINYDNIASELAKNVNGMTLGNMNTDFMQALPEKDRKIIEAVFNNRTAALNAGWADPFKEHNPRVFSIFMRTLERDAKSLSVSKIFASLGHGLTPDDVTTLTRFREMATVKDSIMNQPDVREAFSLVNSMRRLRGIPATEEELFLQEEADNKIKLNILEQARTGVRDEELRKYAENAVSPLQDSAIGNWLGNWWRGTFPQFLGGNVPGIGRRESMTPTQRFKKPDTMRELETFTNQISNEFGEDAGREYYNLWIGDFSGP